jgi:hypothetical protein
MPKAATARDLPVPKRDLPARLLAVTLPLIELPVLAALAVGALVTRLAAAASAALTRSRSTP